MVYFHGLYISRGEGDGGGGGGREDVALLQPLSTSSQGSVPLTGQCHEMDSFFKGLNIFISTFCVCVNGFQGLSTDVHCTIQLLTFYLPL